MENKRPNIKTRHSEIAEYWMSKFIHPDGTVSNKVDSEGLLVCLDAGEPECFICGMSPMSAQNFPLKTYEKILNGDNYLNVWNMPAVKAVLERAHIIPYSLGGEDVPSNLMCLCKSCHKNAPNTNDYGAFIRYVYNEKKSGKYVQGISVDMLKKIYDIMLESGIKEEDVKNLSSDDYVRLLTPINDFQMTTHFGESVNESTLLESFNQSIKKFIADKNDSKQK